MSIRVLIADDRPIVRTGLTMLLDAQPDIDVAGAAADGREGSRGRFRTECIRTRVFQPGPYKTVSDVEYAVAGWVGS